MTTRDPVTVVSSYREDMSSRTVVWRRVGASLMVVACLASCSGSDDPSSETQASTTTPDDLDGDSFVPATDDDPGNTIRSGSDPAGDDSNVVSASCTDEGVAVADDWPFGVADDIVVALTTDDAGQYLLAGATLDPEQVLIDTMDASFPGFDVGAPRGGADDMIVDFSSTTGAARVVLEDPDQDGCWAVDIRAVFEDDREVDGGDVEVVAAPITTSADGAEAPDNGDGGGDSFVDDEGSGDDTVDGSVTTTTTDDDDVPDTIDPFDLVTAVGSGEVISGRGSFRVALARCEVLPLTLDGVASGATLTIETDSGGAVTALWTYDDGVVIEDVDANILRLDETGGTVIANGENPEGPETLFIEFQCD